MKQDSQMLSDVSLKKMEENYFLRLKWTSYIQFLNLNVFGFL